MISSTGNAWSPRIPTVNSRPGINFSTRISGPNRATSAIAASISRSEEHTSELQSQSNLVCRLLLEKKKDPLRQLVAEKQYAPLLRDVERVDEPPALRRLHVPHVLVIGAHAFKEGVGAVLVQMERGAPAPIRHTPPVDIRDGSLQELEVLFHEADAPALPQPGERLAGLAAVDHEDPLAGAQQAVADRALQSLAERQEQHHRERSPGHCEEREEGPGALHLQVADEFPEQDGEHQVRSASTGSSAAARRAGMRPAANATAASNASVAASTIGEIVGTRSEEHTSELQSQSNL